MSAPIPAETALSTGITPTPAEQPAQRRAHDPSATPATSPAPVSVQASAVTGRARTWLRVEAAATAVAAVALCLAIGQPWWLPLVLFLVPDLSALGYLAGPKVGAWTYNLAHAAPLPLVLLGAGFTLHVDPLVIAGIVGLFHLGVDRALGFGVKHDHAFEATHLGTR